MSAGIQPRTDPFPAESLLPYSILSFAGSLVLPSRKRTFTKRIQHCAAHIRPMRVRPIIPKTRKSQYKLCFFANKMKNPRIRGPASAFASGAPRRHGDTEGKGFSFFLPRARAGEGRGRSRATMVVRASRPDGAGSRRTDATRKRFRTTHIFRSFSASSASSSSSFFSSRFSAPQRLGVRSFFIQPENGDASTDRTPESVFQIRINLPHSSHECAIVRKSHAEPPGRRACLEKVAVGPGECEPCPGETPGPPGHGADCTRSCGWTMIV